MAMLWLMWQFTWLWAQSTFMEQKKADKTLQKVEMFLILGLALFKSDLCQII